ncbi:hypothetical protein BDP55DRAFT_676630 [Colletotrichum godetiae]|uniref:RRM domain-containing protein n=1 Tax=Colletotrichum godetiae TaxID=1209918 RepID=A0AAJ0AC39_9PEZI|nr:uncharacterized protein BDP55DRAFT_676630 [Colletotrichum godetiae]KAK1671186.1 hypothetical protein BDP55DRAFT_676630 [Colletotrichum godetiae]
MQSIRRAATRATFTSSVTAAAAPKSQTVSFALRALNAAAIRSFSAAAPRAFSRSIAFREYGQAEGGFREQRGRRQDPSEHVLFVQNYSFDVKAEELSEAFSKYGEVVGVAMPPKKSFCFVYFKTAEAVTEAAENVDGTFWHGRRIVAKARDASARGPARERGERGERGNNRAAKKAIYDGPPTGTIYIGNISFEASDKDLNDLFNSLKDVLDVRIAVDRATGWPRGFAHADFTSIEAATAAIEVLNQTEIHGRKLMSANAPASKPRRGPRSDRDSSKQVEERVENEHAQAEEAQKEQKPEAGEQQNNWNA